MGPLGNVSSISTLACMPKNENGDRARAERMFKVREHQKADASKATVDYHAAEQKLRERTKELRQLRLARELQKKRDVA